MRAFPWRSAGAEPARVSFLSTPHPACDGPTRPRAPGGYGCRCAWHGRHQSAPELLGVRDVARPACALAADAREDVEHLLLVAHQLGLAVDHDAAQLVVDGAVLRQQAHARVALEVPDLLALGERRHHHRAVVLDREPHRHRMREAARADRVDDDGGEVARNFFCSSSVIRI